MFAKFHDESRRVVILRSGTTAAAAAAARTRGDRARFHPHSRDSCVLLCPADLIPDDK